MSLLVAPVLLAGLGGLSFADEEEGTFTWSGVLVKESGTPLLGARICVRYDQHESLRHDVLSDYFEGRFEIDGLAKGPARLSVFALDHDCVLNLLSNDN